MEFEAGDLYRIDLNTDYTRARGYDFTVTGRIMFGDALELFMDMLPEGSSEFQYEKIFKGVRIFTRFSPWEVEQKGGSVVKMWDYVLIHGSSPNRWQGLIEQIIYYPQK